MGLRQQTTDKTRLEGGWRVERRREPAGEETDAETLDRISRRSAFAALMSDLPGGSFAFVMATGIVSIAAMWLGHGTVGAFLAVIPRVCIWIALASWLLGFVAVMQQLLRLLRRGKGSVAHGDIEAGL